MIGPCQYCGDLVSGAERFYRNGCMPCCRRCRWIPGVIGFTLLAVCTVGMALLGVAWWRMP